MWGGGNRVIRANRIRIVPVSASALNLYVFSVYLTIDAPIEGDGDVVMHNNGDNIGSIAPIGINTNFHGKITLRQKVNAGKTMTPYKFQYFLADGRNLGGVYVGSDTNAAIEIAYYPLVNVTNDVLVCEPTRTVKISEGAKFDVKTGKRLAFGTRTTWDGAVVKAGAGTMELAGEARFGDGNPATLPTAGKNALTVAAGALRVSSKTACDGLAISFAAGTKLQLALDAEGDLAQYGLYDVKWSAPLAFADEKLKVEFVGDAPESKVVRGICTVSSEAAASLSDSSFAVAHPRGCVARVSHTDNGDSTVTFSATIMKPGTAVLVR